jgi:hypothetical protein
VTDFPLRSSVQGPGTLLSIVGYQFIQSVAAKMFYMICSIARGRLHQPRATWLSLKPL